MANRPALVSIADLRRAMKVGAEFGMAVMVRPDGTVIISPVPEDAPRQNEGAALEW